MTETEHLTGDPASAVAAPTDLARLARLLRVRWALILAVALLCCGAVLVSLLLRPRTYRATATVMVAPISFPSSLRPDELSLQANEQLLESEASSPRRSTTSNGPAGGGQARGRASARPCVRGSSCRRTGATASRR